MELDLELYQALGSELDLEQEFELELAELMELILRFSYQ